MKFTKIEKISEAVSETVYHLTIEKNHNFFANNLCVHNCGYRGEVGIILVNLSKDEFTINKGDKVAQGVITPVTAGHVINLDKVDEISNDTQRGSTGYGSTGV